VLVAAVTIFLVATFTWTPAAPQVAFTSIRGEKIASAGLRGRVVLVNFWATDCVIDKRGKIVSRNRSPVTDHRSRLVD